MNGSGSEIPTGEQPEANGEIIPAPLTTEAENIPPPINEPHEETVPLTGTDLSIVTITEGEGSQSPPDQVLTPQEIQHTIADLLAGDALTPEERTRVEALATNEAFTDRVNRFAGMITGHSDKPDPKANEEEKRRAEKVAKRALVKSLIVPAVKANGKDEFPLSFVNTDTEFNDEDDVLFSLYLASKGVNEALYTEGLKASVLMTYDYDDPEDSTMTTRVSVQYGEAARELRYDTKTRKIQEITLLHDSPELRAAITNYDKSGALLQRWTEKRLGITAPITDEKHERYDAQAVEDKSHITKLQRQLNEAGTTASSSLSSLGEQPTSEMRFTKIQGQLSAEDPQHQVLLVNESFAALPIAGEDPRTVQSAATNSDTIRDLAINLVRSIRTENPMGGSGSALVLEQERLAPKEQLAKNLGALAERTGAEITPEQRDMALALLTEAEAVNNPITANGETILTAKEHRARAVGQIAEQVAWRAKNSPVAGLAEENLTWLKQHVGSVALAALLDQQPEVANTAFRFLAAQQTALSSGEITRAVRLAAVLDAPDTVQLTDGKVEAAPPPTPPKGEAGEEKEKPHTVRVESAVIKGGGKKAVVRQTENVQTKIIYVTGMPEPESLNSKLASPESVQDVLSTISPPLPEESHQGAFMSIGPYHGEEIILSGNAGGAKILRITADGTEEISSHGMPKVNQDPTEAGRYVLATDNLLEAEDHRGLTRAEIAEISKAFPETAEATKALEVSYLLKILADEGKTTVNLTGRSYRINMAALVNNVTAINQRGKMEDVLTNLRVQYQEKTNSTPQPDVAFAVVDIGEQPKPDEPKDEKPAAKAEPAKPDASRPITDVQLPAADVPAHAATPSQTTGEQIESTVGGLGNLMEAAGDKGRRNEEAFMQTSRLLGVERAKLSTTAMNVITHDGSWETLINKRSRKAGEALSPTELQQRFIQDAKAQGSILTDEELAALYTQPILETDLFPAPTENAEANKEKKVYVHIGEAVHPGEGHTDETNEAAIWADREKGVGIVINGIGGHPDGDKAARSLRESVIAAYVGRPEHDSIEARQAWLKGELIEKIQNDFLEKKKAGEMDRKAGAVFALVDTWTDADGNAVQSVLHVGNVRGYKGEKDHVEQLTLDDSEFVEVYFSDPQRQKEVQRVLSNITHPIQYNEENGNKLITDESRAAFFANIDELNKTFSAEEKTLLLNCWVNRNMLSQRMGKVSFDESTDPPVLRLVNPEPHLTSITVPNGESSQIIICNGGVRDVLTDKTLYDKSRPKKTQHGADNIMEAAIAADNGPRAKSFADDKAVITMDLYTQAWKLEEEKPAEGESFALEMGGATMESAAGAPPPPEGGQTPERAEGVRPTIHIEKRHCEGGAQGSKTFVGTNDAGTAAFVINGKGDEVWVQSPFYKVASDVMTAQGQLRAALEQSPNTGVAFVATADGHIVEGEKNQDGLTIKPATEVEQLSVLAAGATALKDVLGSPDDHDQALHVMQQLASHYHTDLNQANDAIELAYYLRYFAAKPEQFDNSYWRTEVIETHSSAIQNGDIVEVVKELLKTKPTTINNLREELQRAYKNQSNAPQIAWAVAVVDKPKQTEEPVKPPAPDPAAAAEAIKESTDEEDLSALHTQLARILYPDSESPAPDAEDWNLLREAAKLVITTQFSSTSMIQRKLDVNFPKAVALMNALEKLGAVGPPPEGPAARNVLIPPARMDAGESELEELLRKITAIGKASPALPSAATSTETTAAKTASTRAAELAAALNAARPEVPTVTASVATPGETAAAMSQLNAARQTNPELPKKVEEIQNRVLTELRELFGSNAPEKLPPLPVNQEMARTLEEAGYVFTVVYPDEIYRSNDLTRATVVSPAGAIYNGDSAYQEAVQQTHLAPLPNNPYWIAYKKVPRGKAWKYTYANWKYRQDTEAEGGETLNDRRLQSLGLKPDDERGYKVTMRLPKAAELAGLNIPSKDGDIPFDRSELTSDTWYDARLGQYVGISVERNMPPYQINAQGEASIARPVIVFEKVNPTGETFAKKERPVTDDERQPSLVLWERARLRSADRLFISTEHMTESLRQRLIEHPEIPVEQHITQWRQAADYPPQFIPMRTPAEHMPETEKMMLDLGLEQYELVDNRLDSTLARMLIDPKNKGVDPKVILAEWRKQQPQEIAFKERQRLRVEVALQPEEYMDDSLTNIINNSPASRPPNEILKEWRNQQGKGVGKLRTKSPYEKMEASAEAHYDERVNSIFNSWPEAEQQRRAGILAEEQRHAAASRYPGYHPRR